MPEEIDRRAFLGHSAATVFGAAGLASTAVAGLAPKPAGASQVAADQSAGPKKAVEYGMLPGNLSIEERFKLAKDVGFDGVEVPPVNAADADKLRAGAEKAGIRIHSVIYGGWDNPLSSDDPDVIKRGLDNASSAIRSAHIMGADTILLVPALVNAKTRYGDAYTRSHANVRKLIPVAEENKIVICIEEVWNNFLMSPLEYVRYIDEFKSPWVQAYFDVGNVTPFAWPEDWVRTVGKRIRKVHLKDFKGGPGLFGGIGGSFVNLRDGSINWPEVRKAFAEIGYTGFMTTELGGGDEAYLRDVAGRVDKIFAGV